MYNCETFYAGTGGCGTGANTHPLPSDVPAWGTLSRALSTHQTATAMAWVQRTNRAIDRYDGRTFYGYRFSDAARRPQWEVSASVVAAAGNATGDVHHSLSLLLGKYGRMPASLNVSTTGFAWEYFPLSHVASTAWTRFALDGTNPYVFRASAAYRYADKDIPAACRRTHADP